MMCVWKCSSCLDVGYDIWNI